MQREIKNKTTFILVTIPYYLNHSICIFFSSNFLVTFSPKTVYITENKGTLNKIPTNPHKLPPIVIATKTQIPGNQTELPTTFGYITLPSICCKN